MQRNFTLLLIIIHFFNIHTGLAQSTPFSYDQTNIDLKSDFIAYGQSARSLEQKVKLKVLSDYLELNKSERVNILLDYPSELNKFLDNKNKTADYESIEKEFMSCYHSKTYIDLQIKKIKDYMSICRNYKDAHVVFVGTNDITTRRDSILFLAVKKTLEPSFVKSFFVTSPQNIIEYYYADERFSGNLFTCVGMLTTDSLFHNRTLVSIGEVSRMLQKPDGKNFTRANYYLGMRNYQRDRINMIPYKNQEYLCINLWEYLAENNITYDYMILFNELKLNK